MTDHLLAWQYAEDFCVEDSVSALARHRAKEYGIAPLSQASCAFLTFLASVADVRTAVEIGTGTGVSGLALLRGRSGLTLTTIDCEAEVQAIARQSFTSAGFRSGLTRLIHGRSVDMLPRLAASSYDLVLVDGDPLEAAGDVEEARRILSPGGILVVARALRGGLVADPARRDSDIVAIRKLGKDLSRDDDLSLSLIPVGEGLLLARMP